MVGMVFPPELAIEASLKEGAVYFLVNHNYESQNFHYYIVLNCCPETDQEIVMVNATSKIDKGLERIKYRNLPQDTFVVVKPSEYCELRIATGFDCNNPTLRTKAELVELLKNNELETKQDCPITLLNKLRKAIVLSPMVEQRVIDMVKK